MIAPYQDPHAAQRGAGVVGRAGSAGSNAGLVIMQWQQADKTSVRIIDWLDLGHPVPQRMGERRLRGYQAMGRYALISDP